MRNYYYTNHHHHHHVQRLKRMCRRCGGVRSSSRDPEKKDLIRCAANDEHRTRNPSAVSRIRMIFFFAIWAILRYFTHDNNALYNIITSYNMYGDHLIRLVDVINAKIFRLPKSTKKKIQKKTLLRHTHANTRAELIIIIRVFFLDRRCSRGGRRCAYYPNCRTRSVDLEQTSLQCTHSSRVTIVYVYYMRVGLR